MNIDTEKTAWTTEEMDALRAQTRAAIDQRGLTQAGAAREMQIGSSTLSTWFSNTYEGDSQKVCRAVTRWLYAQKAQAAVLDLVPAAPAFVMTETAREVIGVCRSAQVLGDMGVVVGPPGIGKTRAIAQYKSLSPRVVVATASAAICNMTAILQTFLTAHGAQMGKPSGAGRLGLTLEMRKHFKEGWLLVLDEAQHAELEAIEELRAIQDETGCGLVLSGNPKVLTLLQGEGRQSDRAQLYSRTGVRAVLKGNSPEEVEQILEPMGVTNAEVLKIAKAIAAKDSLRVVVKAMRRAIMAANGDQSPLDPRYVRLAYRSLGGELTRAAA